jgi:hypothetical protein
MDLYEHMGKDLFRAHGIPTPLGRVARSPGEAAEAAREFGGKAVVKVQVQAGGRGKGGGVVLVDSAQRASEEAARLLRDGFAGHDVDRVLVEELLPIRRELYTSFLLDRSVGEYLAMMTAEGGIDIETLAHERPEAIRRVHVDPMLGLRAYHVRELVGTLPADAREGAGDVLRKMFSMLWELDATMGALQTMQKTGADILHSAVRFYAGAEIKYHYKLRLKYDFWAAYAPCPDDVLNAYQIAAAGHGGFVVRRDAWDEIGGYGPEELYAGDGGEEISFNLTAWRYGKTSWIDPRLVHYHYAGVRGYDRHFTDEYYVNMMVSAFVTGGEAWLYRLFESFMENTHVRKSRTNMYDLLEIAYRRGAKYSAVVESKSKKSLDDLLVWFKNNQVAM